MYFSTTIFQKFQYTISGHIELAQLIALTYCVIHGYTIKFSWGLLYGTLPCPFTFEGTKLLTTSTNAVEGTSPVPISCSCLIFFKFFSTWKRYSTYVTRIFPLAIYLESPFLLSCCNKNCSHSFVVPDIHECHTIMPWFHCTLLCKHTIERGQRCCASLLLQYSSHIAVLRVTQQLLFFAAGTFISTLKVLYCLVVANLSLILSIMNS